MKVSKKILSILLAVCLLVACLPLSTSAAENDQSLQIMQEMMDEYNTLEVESSMHESSE